ncbi:MAG: tetratricopeptide repeat protein [Methyloglobulus sp.]|nr:tetratricopeptide repeat protein [Methyloglobulus sp.]
MLYLLLPLLILFSPLAWSGQGDADKKCAQVYAQVVSLQGKLFYDPASKGEWQQAKLNDRLCEGGQIRVGPFSRATVLLPDGIINHLGEGSVLALNKIVPGENTMLELFKGFVAVISRTPKRLTINTPIVNAGPEGTEFAISVDDNKASLWVYEGGVKFYNAKGSVYLKPGQGAQTLKGQAPQAKIDIKPQDAVNWALYYPPVLAYPDAGTVIDSGLRTAIQDYRQGHVDVALSQLDSLSAGQQTPYFYKVRGAMRLSAGQDQLALQDIESILAKNPNDAEALALQSVRALTQNRKDEAYALANKAVTANPQSASAYSALSYAEQGRFNLDKAQAAADQAAKLAPHDAMVWARKAELELSQGSTTESKHAAQKALDLDANLERTQTVMGFAHLLRMDTDEALASFTKAIQLDSTSPLARLGLGLAKIRNGDLKEGRQDLETAAILDPNNSIVRSYLGKAYYEERRPDMADTQFGLAKDRDPKDPTPYFYDAINKQTTNRPVEALHDMQKAIELNDNRGVYRSKFQLDKDTAARQVGLGRIFNNLGFDDPANRQAMKSLAIDPSNYSAHRLLSDSYATKPRHEIARASEHLQSQLLQPLNYNPIQPSLAYTDLNIIRGIGPNDTAFNEYNRMFERNGVRFTTTGIAGSNSTLGDEAALSGIFNKFSFSLGQLRYHTDGFRKNNDLTHNIYNAFAQYEITPKFSVQAEYRHRETEHGDLGLYGGDDLIIKGYRRKLHQDTYRYGMKFSPSKNSDWLLSLVHANRTEQQIPIPNLTQNTKSYDIDVQNLFHNEYMNTISGLGLYRTDNHNDAPKLFNTTQYFAYVYSNFKLKNLTLTTGLSFDHYRDNNDYQRGNNQVKIDFNSLNPKLGLIWQFNKSFSLRAAIFKSVKSTIVDNQLLQPTQIAGFNQFFDEWNGTSAWLYGIGMDAQFNNFYSGIEAYKRELNIPYYEKKSAEELYRFYLNWIPLPKLAINTGFKFENYRGHYYDAPVFAETTSIPLEFRFFSTMGFFATLKGTYINQFFNLPQSPVDNFKSNFYLVDAAVGFRFPKQYGLLSLEAKNLFDTHFKYVDRTFQGNEQRPPDFIPERLLFARITLNF